MHHFHNQQYFTSMIHIIVQNHIHSDLFSLTVLRWSNPISHSYNNPLIISVHSFTPSIRKDHPRSGARNPVMALTSLANYWQWLAVGTNAEMYAKETFSLPNWIGSQASFWQGIACPRNPMTFRKKQLSHVVQTFCSFGQICGHNTASSTSFNKGTIKMSMLNT